MVATGLLLTGGAPLEAQPQPAPSKAEEEVKAQIDGARGLAEEGRADVAVEALQKVIAASPQSMHIPAAYLLLGKILSDQKNYEEAGAYYRRLDRKSTRLNSSHQIISYAVFCLKKKKKK